MVDHGFPVASAHNFGVASAHNFRGGLVELENWVYPSSWALCKESFPDTNFKEQIAYTSTRSNDSFADESRTIFKFDPTLEYDKFHRINFGRIGCNMTGHTDLARLFVADSTYGTRVDWTGSNSNFPLPGIFIRCYATIRITPVISDFDTSLITWNNIGAVTTAPAFEAYPFVGQTLPPPSAGSGTKNRDFRTRFVGGFSDNVSFTPNTGSGIEGIKVIEPVSPPATNFFGFIIDIFFSHNRINPSFTNVTQEAFLGITVETKDFVYEV